MASRRWRSFRSEVDDAGYDLVFEVSDRVRHVQLKASRLGASTASVNIQLMLGLKPSGCVIWMIFEPDSMTFDHFLWFGGSAGEPLPDISDFKTAKHTKADSTGHKSERKSHRVVSKGKFTRLDTIAAVVDRLFGHDMTGRR